MEVRQNPGLPVRQLLVGVLAATLVTLSILYLARPDNERHTALRPDMQEIDVVIDGLLKSHGILPQWVRTWRVNVPGTSFFRVERRVWVPRDFAILPFNHELDRQLSAYDARVIGLERTAQGTVTLHVLQHALVVESLSLVPKPDLERDSPEQ